MDGEEQRTGSTESENSSENSYVQVSSDDVRTMEQQQQQPPPNNMPALGEEEEEEEEEEGGAGLEREGGTAGDEEEEDLYGSGEDNQAGHQQVTSDPLYITSPPDEEELPMETPFVKMAPPIQTSSTGVEDVPPVVSAKKPSFQATGYLSFLNFLHPIELEVIYWRDIKLSAVVLGIELVVLLTLSLNTLLHTAVLLLLSFLVVSLVYIITRIAIDSFYNKEAKNPFSDYLNRKITLPEDKILEVTQLGVEKLDRYFNTLVRLLLFDNIKASLKFGVVLWLLSFVTNYLTFQTVMTLLIVVPFSVPPVYQKFQRRIDPIIEDAVARGTTLYKRVRENIPFYKKTKVE